MQAVGGEFNYSETTFVLPPREVGHPQTLASNNAARGPVRGEHPNVGTPSSSPKERGSKASPPIDD